MIKFNHFNFNVLNLEKSLDFYARALDLKPVREQEASDGSFKLVYLGDGVTDFTLELTWLRDRKEPYNLGECEFHLAFHVDAYEELHARMKRWAASALRIRPWVSILFRTPTGTGLRLCRPAGREQRPAAYVWESRGGCPEESSDFPGWRRGFALSGRRGAVRYRCL